MTPIPESTTAQAKVPRLRTTAVLMIAILAAYTAACTKQDSTPPPDIAAQALQHLSEAATSQIERDSSARDLAESSKAAAEALSNNKTPDHQHTRQQLARLTEILHHPGWPEAAHNLAHALEINPAQITQTQRNHIAQTATQLANTLNDRP